MTRLTTSLAAVAALALSAGAAIAADAPPSLTAQTPIEIPGGAAHWDFMLADGDMHRILACHPGAKSLVVLDLTTNQPTVINTGEVNGVAIDTAENQYFAAGGGQHVSVIDRTTLKEITEIPTTGPCDDVIYDPANGLVYVDHDDGTEVWVIDPKTDKITGSVTVAGAPEVLLYDASTDKVYQNIKPTDQVQVIDPKSGAVTATWSTTPAHSPHGLAIDSDKGLLFSAGKNGKIVAIDIKSGAVTTSTDIAKGVDQIVYDASKHLIFCACGTDGEVSIVKVTKKGNLKHLEDVTVPKGTHTIAIDPSTHDAWVSYSTTTGSFLEDLKPAEVASN